MFAYFHRTDFLAIFYTCAVAMKIQYPEFSNHHVEIFNYKNFKIKFLATYT